MHQFQPFPNNITPNSTIFGFREKSMISTRDGRVKVYVLEGKKLKLMASEMMSPINRRATALKFIN